MHIPLKAEQPRLPIHDKGCDGIPYSNEIRNHRVLDFMSKTLKIDSVLIETTKKEFLLLYTLFSSLGRIFSRTQLLDEIWGMDSESLERTVDVHISKLREKLVKSDVTILSMRGLGYKAERK